MELHQTDSILKEFAPISLEEMDSVALMDRTDCKFIFPSTKLPHILAMAPNHYRILEINDQRRFTYTTTYLDTDDYQFYRHHIAGKLNRYKVRFRVYESTSASYLEIKFKSNKMRTHKWRIKNAMDCGMLDSAAQQFITENLGCNIRLKPVQTSKFERITMVSLEHKERVTIDYNLQFSSIDGRQISLPYLSIAEIKQEKSKDFSAFKKILMENRINPSGFSKYCIGNALLKIFPDKNGYKEKLLILEKIKNDIIYPASR